MCARWVFVGALKSSDCAQSAARPEGRVGGDPDFFRVETGFWRWNVFYLSACRHKTATVNPPPSLLKEFLQVFFHPPRIEHDAAHKEHGSASACAFTPPSYLCLCFFFSFRVFYGRIKSHKLEKIGFHGQNKTKRSPIRGGTINLLCQMFSKLFRLFLGKKGLWVKTLC